MFRDFIARGIAAQNRNELRAVAATSTLSRSFRVVVAGDSITAGSSGRPNHPANQSWGRGYAALTLWQSGLRGVVNAGVGGNTSTQMLARWQTDVLAYNPDAVLLMIGTNDVVTTGFNDAKLATLMNNIEQMVVQSLAANVLPIIVTPPAKDGNKADTRRIIPFYYWLTEAYSVPLIDMFAITVDPASGGWKAGLSDDGTPP
jgi:lysophospholipase L1-like esterase